MSSATISSQPASTSTPTPTPTPNPSFALPPNHPLNPSFTLPHHPSSNPSPSNPSSTHPTNQPTLQLPPKPSPSSGLRTPSNRKTIYDRNLNRTRNAELSRASFAYLFSEMVIYAQRRVTGIQDLEKRLNQQGYPLGLRLLPLILHREGPTSTTSRLFPPQSTTSSSSNTSSSSGGSSGSIAAPRPTRILALLQFLHGPLWRHLFGRSADAIEHSATHAHEYMISDNEPLVNAAISVPKDMGQLNCAAFVAGVLEGVCDGCGIRAGVTAHNANEGETGGEGGGGGGGRGRGTGGETMWPGKTVFLIRFEEGVVERESLVVSGAVTASGTGGGGGGGSGGGGGK